jgi:hypothetical protein
MSARSARQTLAIRLAASLPGPITTDADVERVTFRRAQTHFPAWQSGRTLQNIPCEVRRLYFVIPSSRLSRGFSARSRGNSNSSGVTTLSPVPMSLPLAAAFDLVAKGLVVQPKRLANFAETLRVLPPIPRTRSCMSVSVSSISCLPKLAPI